MGDHLEQAAKFARSRESTLNITDSVCVILSSYCGVYLCMHTITGGFSVQGSLLQFHSIHDIPNQQKSWAGIAVWNLL